MFAIIGRMLVILLALFLALPVSALDFCDELRQARRPVFSEPEASWLLGKHRTLHQMKKNIWVITESAGDDFMLKAGPALGPTERTLVLMGHGSRGQ